MLYHFTSFAVDFNRHGNRWSSITVQMGMYVIFLVVVIYFKSFSFGIYTRSPGTYKALKDFKILKLPSKATLQSYKGAFIHEPGSSAACKADQLSRYIAFKDTAKKLDKHEPQGDGALIFDEANSLLQPSQFSKQTSYILQFLWRDLTSDFDIVGLYFISESKFVLACVLELFQSHGLKTSLLECHGGSSK